MADCRRKLVMQAHQQSNNYALVRYMPGCTNLHFDQFPLAEFARLRLAFPSSVELNQFAPYPELMPSSQGGTHMMAPEKGPNRLNIKFTNSGTKLVGSSSARPTTQTK
jgi:hypothetical protein